MPANPNVPNATEIEALIKRARAEANTDLSDFPSAYRKPFGDLAKFLDELADALEALSAAPKPEADWREPTLEEVRGLGPKLLDFDFDKKAEPAQAVDDEIERVADELHGEFSPAFDRSDATEIAKVAARALRRSSAAPTIPDEMRDLLEAVCDGNLLGPHSRRSLREWLSAHPEAASRSNEVRVPGHGQGSIYITIPDELRDAVETLAAYAELRSLLPEHIDARNVAREWLSRHPKEGA